MVLQTLRERLTGIMAIFILGLIAIPFAFVGVNSYFAPDSTNNVAVVNEEGITLNDFNASFQNYRERMRSLLGPRFDAADFDGVIVRREHLDTMIDRVLLRQAAAETGLAVDDQVLAQAIREVPAFQMQGEFDPEVYQNQLTAQGMTPQEFEDQMRSSMVLSQFPSSIAESSIATNRELDEYIRIQDQRRVYKALVVPAEVDSPSQDESGEESAEGADETASTEDEVPAPEDSYSEEQIEAWFAEHSGEFRHPERVTIEYLELNADQLGEGEAIDEEELKQRFEEQKGRFMTPEARLTSHILISVDPAADDAEVETAREEAEAIYERVLAGEDFAELARKNSDDQGSAAIGGDLDWVEPGVLTESFEDALYQLSMEAPVSEPVQTGFGWHVIQLRDIRPAEGMSFEEARDTLSMELLTERREREYLDIADRLVDIIYEDPTTLEAAAEELDLEILTAGPFSRDGGIGIAAYPDVIESAFSDLVLLQGSVSDPVNLGTNHMVVVRLREHLPEADMALEEVREEVIASMKQEDAMAAAESKARDFLARLESGETMEAIAEESGVELLDTESEGARRNDPVGSPELREQIFDLDAPRDDEPRRTVLELANGFALVELERVLDGSLTEEESARRDAYKRRLANAFASNEALSFIRVLRSQSDVQVFEDRL